MNRLKKQMSGFTLMELMVVLGIVGILSALAYPHYTKYILKSHRHDGMSALMDAAQKQNVYRARTASYALNAADANINLASPEGYYDNLAIDFGDCGNISNCYTMQIIPTTKGGQNQDTVTAYRLKSNGEKHRYEDGAWVEGWR
jgi:type IV pilus assembly protein PilE